MSINYSTVNSQGSRLEKQRNGGADVSVPRHLSKSDSCEFTIGGAAYFQQKNSKCFRVED